MPIFASTIAIAAHVAWVANTTNLPYNPLQTPTVAITDEAGMLGLFNDRPALQAQGVISAYLPGSNQIVLLRDEFDTDDIIHEIVHYLLHINNIKQNECLPFKIQVMWSLNVEGNPHAPEWGIAEYC